jgi:YfiH family protein
MRREEHANGLPMWVFSFSGSGVVAGVTTRHGGRSAGAYASLNLGYHVGDDAADVAANRALVCEAFGVEQLTVPDQQHGNKVVVVDRALAGAGHASLDDAVERLGATDALVTNRPGVALAIMVADCAPVIFYDPTRGALGVAHAGRPGAVLDVVGATVAMLAREFGSRPADLLVGVGPCVAGKNYEIGGSSEQSAREAFGGEFLADTRPGHACFDLVGAVRRRVREAGIPDENVETAGVDTFESGDDFFSDRRERPCGRFMLVAALRGS